MFFDQHRLARITTQTHTGTAYQSIDRWDLRHRFVGQGEENVRDASGILLRLEGITRIGLAKTGATQITMPEVGFNYTFFPNRVDGVDDGSLSLERPRISSVRTDTGATISVNYRTECSASDMPGDDDTAQRTNQRLCYPVKWFSGSASGGEVDYFHKYVVSSTVEQGAPPSGDALITGSLDKTTTYTYGGGAFWAKPTGAMVKPNEVTYSDFRGFAELTTTVGKGSEASSTKTRYYRGTEQQLQAGPAGHSVPVTDRTRYQGQVLESTELDGTKPISQTVTQPGTPTTVATGRDGATATRLPSSTAYGFTFDKNQAVVARTRTVTTYDGNSQPVTIDDLGDLTNSADNRCTRITYTPDTSSRHLVSLPAITETVAKACDQPVNRPADILSANQATYDAAGRLTRGDRINPDTGIGWVMEREIRQYDDLGRPLRIADAAGNESTVSYTASAGGLLQSVLTQTPDPDGSGPLTGFTSTTTYNPLTGTVASTDDANGKTTTGKYDALGRLTAVRYPQHSVDSVKYSYVNSPTGLNAVQTDTLGANGNTYHRSVELYDGLLRSIQTQVESRDAGENRNADAAARGRMVAHTFYDSAGRIRKQTGQWWNTGMPKTTMLVPPAVTPAHTTVEYDAASRPVAQILWTGTDSNPDYEKSRTVIGYDGLTTITVPPMGGTPQATTTDPRGQVVTLREFIRDADTHSSATTVAGVLALQGQNTTYTYDAAGRRTGMKNPANDAWTYTYDWAGRQIKAVDPDSGTTTTTYNALDQVTRRTQGNGKGLNYTYDAIGRVTTFTDITSTTGTPLGTYLYDQAKFPDGTPVLGAASGFQRSNGPSGSPISTSIERYNAAYQPLDQTIEVPNVVAFTQLESRKLTTGYTYTADGQVASIKYPAITKQGGTVVLGSETVTTAFDTASMPSWMSGGFGWGTYVAESRFTAEGLPLLADLGNTYGAVVSHRYENGTNQLLQTSLDREGVSGTEVDLNYGYDAAGNVTSIKDLPTAAALATNAKRDQQCFNYDGLQRLHFAWASNDGNCTLSDQQVGSSTTGGPAAYFNKYTYDIRGNRIRLQNSSGSIRYGYPSGSIRPHAVGSLHHESGDEDYDSDFRYDGAGNRIEESYAGTGGPTTFVWDHEGKLSSSAGSNQFYDGSGNRIAQAQSTNFAKIYLPGGQEVSIRGTAVSSTRIYDFAGQSVAVRTAAGLGAVTSIVSDHHGTPVAAVHNTNWNSTSVKRIYTDPFGRVRGTPIGTALPGSIQFLGEKKDTFGYTLLGARFYDERTGSFVSTDPLLDPGTPAQFNAYVYSGHNPVTWSDPSGLFWKELGQGLGAAANAVGGFVKKHQAEIVGAVVGIAVTAGCLAITAGAGSIGCLVAGGAAAGAVTSLYKSAQTGKFSVGGLVRDTVIGGVSGLAGGVLGNAAAAVIRVATPAVAQLAGNAIREGARAVTSRFGQASAATAQRTAASRASITQGSAVQSLPAQTVRFSQRSVSGADAIESSMRTSGWRGSPIDVVRMNDSALTSVDNTRLLAAARAGINVRAVIRNFDDVIPGDQAIRFPGRGGSLPSTWGEAASNRIANQGARYRSTYPNGSPLTGWIGD